MSSVIGTTTDGSRLKVQITDATPALYLNLIVSGPISRKARASFFRSQNRLVGTTVAFRRDHSSTFLAGRVTAVVAANANDYSRTILTVAEQVGAISTWNVELRDVSLTFSPQEYRSTRSRQVVLLAPSVQLGRLSASQPAVHRSALVVVVVVADSSSSQFDAAFGAAPGDFAAKIASADLATEQLDVTSQLR